MAEKNRTCIVCRTKYTWCNNCSDNSKKHETWRNLYCSENCRNIFDILSSHTFNHINDQQAKDKLRNMDLSKLEYFRNDFKEQVKKIQSANIQAQQQPKQPQPQQNQNQNQNKEIVKENFKK